MDNWNPTILIVDDDQELLSLVSIILKSEGTVISATSPSQAIEVTNQRSIDLAIVDLDFQGDDKDGLFLLKHLSHNHPNIPIIVLSGDKNTERVVGATHFYLVDFVVKTGRFHESLLHAVRSGLLQRSDNHRFSSFSVFSTRSPAVIKILEDVTRIARSESRGPILIRGECGSGKEFMARYISHCLQKPLISANMAAIPQDLVESELFGSIAGSYTGAMRDREGLIPKANGKIFFLDEIGDCSIKVQASLLRTIQEGEIRPVGSNHTKEVSVRFLAATNKNLEQMVSEGSFRDDLLQRLNAFPVKLPPLRERPEDIIFYSEKFLKDCSTSRRFFLSPSGEQALLEYKWPGNVRELWNTIQRIIALAPTLNIDSHAVVTAIKMGESKAIIPFCQVARIPTKEDLTKTLSRVNGNRTQAAAFFGVHKITILRWLKGYGIENMVPGKAGRPRIFPGIRDQ